MRPEPRAPRPGPPTPVTHARHGSTYAAQGSLLAAERSFRDWPGSARRADGSMRARQRSARDPDRSVRAAARSMRAAQGSMRAARRCARGGDARMRAADRWMPVGARWDGESGRAYVPARALPHQNPACACMRARPAGAPCSPCRTSRNAVRNASAGSVSNADRRSARATVSTEMSTNVFIRPKTRHDLPAAYATCLQENLALPPFRRFGRYHARRRSGRSAGGSP